ncbi:response regulator transcription factor [Stappia sp.]|jgi:DNA-binding response OmpR family regulator|uniref:response regulator transcription factor n=1 Tax=Stappia sp. TaxID=1870903 RepID=UPI003A9977F6
MTQTVLIVDDETDLTGFLRDVIEDDGYSVRMAGTVEAARRAIADAAPDLLLIDAALPDGKGYALCQELRAAEATRNMPMILMSAASRPVDEEKGLALGADAFLGKPFSADALTGTVGRLLGACPAVAAGHA